MTTWEALNPFGEVVRKTASRTIWRQTEAERRAA